MKKVWQIIGWTLAGVGLAIYCLVALANYSVVQSYAAAEVGRRLSEAWGGKVSIGSLHADPFDHLVANNLLMMAPDGDTILDARVLRVRFGGFPFSAKKQRLNLKSVYLRDAYYHLASWEMGDTTAPEYVRRSPLFVERPGTNLQHIVDCYYRPPSDTIPLFTVDVVTVVLRNVHYKMDLPDKRPVVYDHGVEIPHMEFYDINCKINDVHVVNDDVTCRLVRLKTVERSGFRVNNIAANVHVSPHDITVTNFHAETDNSKIDTEVEINYDGWESLVDYLNNARHTIEIKENSSVAVSDLAYWAPALWGIDAQLLPTAIVKGSVSDMDIQRLSLRFGNASEVYIAGVVKNLPEIENLWVDMEAINLLFEESDITSLMAQMPRYVTPQVADILRQIQYIDLTSQAVGSLHGLGTANLNMVCGLGNLRADLTSRAARRGRHVILNANSDGMGLTPLGSDWLTHSGLDLNLEADIPNHIRGVESIKAQAELSLNGSVVRGNKLNPLDLHASMENGEVTLRGECNDTIADFALISHLKLADTIRGYHIDLQLNHLDAEALGIIANSGDKGLNFKDIGTHVVANFKGNDIDNLNGGAMAYRTHVGGMKIKEVRLNVNSDSTSKHLQLESDAVSATLNGHFAYADLPVMAQAMCHQVIPSYLGLVPQLDSNAVAATEANTVNFHLRWNDGNGMLQQLVPGLTIANGTRIDGAYSSGDLLRLVARSEWVTVGSVRLDGIGLRTGMEDSIYIVDIESSNVSVGDMNLLSDAFLTLASSPAGAAFSMLWGDTLQFTRGDLLFSLNSGDICVERPYFYVGDSRWKVDAEGFHIETDPQLALAAERIRLASDQQYIDARLQLTGQDNDRVELNFNNFGLSLLGDLLLQDTPVDVEGRLSGRFSLYGLAAIPYFNANLAIDSARLNKQDLGRLSLVSTWNAEMNTLNLQLHGGTLHATGWLGLGPENPDINLGIDFNRFDLTAIAPLISNFSSRLEGQIDGQVDISGTLKNPIVLGDAYISNGVLKVDVTGVTYFFNDSLWFSNNLVSLNNFRIIDQMGNIATLDGDINYNGFENIDIDLTLSTDNLLVLNLRSGDDFYGTLLVQADGTVRGGTDHIDIGIKAKTNPGSTLTVPISDRRQVRGQNFIIFEGSDMETPISQDAVTKNTFDFGIEVDLTITSDLQLDLPMSFSEVSVGVKGSGNGDLHMSLDENLDPEVQGAYEISSGSLKLGVASLLAKTFTLEPGSNLNFQGSLPDARFDLKAVYSQRVNLSTLTGSLSTLDNTQKYIQVEDIIAIAGTLTEPTLRFDLRLPNSDQSVEDEVFSYIDRNSERDMLNQSMSLLFLGSFYNAGGGMNENSNLLSSGLSSGYSMVASTMGSMVSDMVQIVNVDFKYKAATELTNEQVDLNISKDWGRLYLESTLGYGGDSRELEETDGGNAVIDALLGYRITPMVHVYAYNRTNNNDYTRLDLPYKQGAGIKLTKDFNHWSDLIRRKEEKIKHEK